MQEESSTLSRTIITKLVFSLRNTLNLASIAFLLNKVVVHSKFEVLNEDAMMLPVSPVHQLIEDKLIMIIANLLIWELCVSLCNTFASIIIRVVLIYNLRKIWWLKLGTRQLKSFNFKDPWKFTSLWLKITCKYRTEKYFR